MMIILARLKHRLSHMVRDLHEVVFVLVEIRKPLELTGENLKHQDLVLHCDWVLHSELRGPQAQAIVRLFETLMKMGEDADTSGSKYHQVLIEDLVDVTTMSRFCNSLRAFLIQYGPPTEVVDIDVLWNEFVTGYLMVIQDCPLKCVSQGLKYVDAVSLTVSNIKGPYDASRTDNVRAQLNWEWQSLNTNNTNVLHRITTFIKDEPLSTTPLPSAKGQEVRRKRPTRPKLP
ncbi:MAG TPA: hypothetical protein VN924_12945 [Bryobacteraceae bacterium]|nr:hypothetical protein [Bryobacteraceae bacterium]